MALYGIVDIKMRMLKIIELKRIMGFPENYTLIGTQADQKKFIGNAVEVNIARVLCEALVEEIVDEYHDNFVFIKKKPWLIIRLIIYNVIQLTAYFSISYVIYLGFGLSGTDYLTIISCQAFVLMISGFMPLPGALGAAREAIRCSSAIYSSARTARNMSASQHLYGDS